jgi:hypothetical protein
LLPVLLDEGPSSRPDLGASFLEDEDEEEEDDENFCFIDLSTV